MNRVLNFPVVLVSFIVVQTLVAVTSAQTVTLTQADFAEGTYRIQTPGLYRLGENIVFKPNGATDMDEDEPEKYLFPTDEQRAEGGLYAGPAYNLGFFAAITVESNDVILDLAGRSLVQSEEHALMQRFFALIELSNGPFPAGAGPFVLNSVDDQVDPNNVTVMNGEIGLSAHHSIHGNGCTNVVIKDLKMTNFEVAAISLNNAHNVKIENVEISDSRVDVPVSGRYSNLIFATRFATVNIDIDDDLRAANDLQRAVREAREKIYEVAQDVFRGREVDDSVFGSLTEGLPDGSLLAGILLHPRVWVGEFLSPGDITTYSTGFELTGVTIERLSMKASEMAAFVVDSTNAASSGYSGAHVKDNVGAVFDIDNCRDIDDDDEYDGNALSDIQIALAAYGLECLSENGNPTCLEKEGTEAALSLNTIGQDIIDWAEGDKDFEDLEDAYNIVSDHDFMFHFMKGIVGITVGGITQLTMTDVVIDRLENHATPTERSLFFQNAGGYIGYGARATAISSSVDITGSFTASNIYSAYGADVMAADVRNEAQDVSLSIGQANLPVDTATIEGTLDPQDRRFQTSGCPFASNGRDDNDGGGRGGRGLNGKNKKKNNMKHKLPPNHKNLRL